jgi:hypothetical protein
MKESPMPHDDKLIDHLSREIETHTNTLMTFRARINMAVFVGPFVLLGSLLVAAKGIPRDITIDGWTVASIVGLALSYITMGLACAVIEAHIWRQCNVWRRLIAKVTNGSTTKITEVDLVFPESLHRGYTIVYLAMILAFGCTMYIVSRITIT